MTMDALRFGLTLAAELIPLFLVISTVVYLVVEKVTPARIRAVLGGRSRWMGVPLAAGLGALTPFCSCSTVPMVNGMKSAGIPVSSLIAFLIASPLINPVAVALLGTAVGMHYAALYAVSGVVFAIVAGVVVERWYGLTLGEASPAAEAASAPSCASNACAPAPDAVPMPTPVAMRSGGIAVLSAPAANSCCAAVAAPAIVVPPLGLSLRNAFSKALTDLRKLWVALALAIVVGAIIHGYVPADLLARIAGPEQAWAIPAAALLGVPVYASVVVLLPLGSSLLAKGVGIGAVTAFLMGASGFSLPEGIMLSKILPRGLLLRVLTVFCMGVVLIGYGFHWLAI
jgi:uncharacterized protein